ncbi:hypothetical protein AcV7_002659 [Taiwanofungus camphoratus]|nr:hypothetical protein AcV7_002659 [Antrodia cinnamomea]
MPLQLGIKLNLALAFSAVRVYAISNRDWRFSCIVFVLGLIPVATNIYQYSQSKLVASQGICSAIFTIITIVTRVFAIAVDTFAVCVTLHATYGVKRLAVKAKANVSIVTLLLRDGTIYFSVLLALNVTQMVLFATTSFGDFGLLIDVLTSILLSRFFLNLRQVYLSRGDNDIQLSQMSDLRFASKIVGNMGAPLNHGPSAFDIAETPDVGSSADEVAAGNLPLWDNQDKDEPRDSDVCLVAKEPFTDGFGLPDVDWDVREIVSE